MKHIRKFESHREYRQKYDLIQELVMQKGNDWTVKANIDIPQSLINAYVKKTKETTGKDLKKFFGDAEIAQDMVKFVTTNFMDVDNIHGGALTGDEEQAVQVEGPDMTQPQAQVQMQPGMQAQPQMQMQPQGQVQPQMQAQPGMQAQPQVQAQMQAQPGEVQGQPGMMQGQPQAQPQAQPQVQVQAQAQGEFEDIEDEDELNLEEDENTEELPL